MKSQLLEAGKRLALQLADNAGRVNEMLDEELLRRAFTAYAGCRGPEHQATSNPRQLPWHPHAAGKRLR